MRVLLVLVLLAAVGLAAAASASAAEITFEPVCGKYMSCSTNVRYEAGPGERNDVRAVMSRTQGQLAIFDPGVQITVRPATAALFYLAVAPSCEVSAGVALCELVVPLRELQVNTGDGDDRADLSTIAVPTMLDGGPGDDALIGGSSLDTLVVGAGTDSLDGGDGQDTVMIGDDAGSARVDLRARSVVTSGGRAVLAGIENAIGGPGDDELLGDDGPNALRGGGGAHDVLRGRGGDDALTASGRLFGNAGDDRLRLDGARGEVYGAGVAMCGAGDDVVTAIGSRAVVDARCEKLSLRNLRLTIKLGIRAGARVPRLTVIGSTSPVPYSLGARLRARVGGVSLGHASRRVRRGSERRLTLRLSASGVRLVHRRRALRALLSVRARDGERLRSGAVMLRLSR